MSVSWLAHGLRKMTGVRALVAARWAGSDVSPDRGAPNLAARIGAARPTIVIDAARPFQCPGEQSAAVARAAIACGTLDLDLSDDAAFTF